MSPEHTVFANDPTPLEADDDTTSDYYESTNFSSTQSVTDSIREHVYENGRQYHRKSQGKYYLPSDESEQDRLDLLHHLNLELLGGKICMTAFEEDPALVLDCGTGTGIWALDFGDEHPGSQVIGVDLAPIQPSWTAPNVRFELDDLEEEWTFREKFDYIHSRDLVTAVKDWPRYLKQMYNFTRPGGYVEISEHNVDRWKCDDDSMGNDSAYLRYSAHMVKAMKSQGLNPNLTLSDYKHMLEEAGFVDIKTYEFKLAVGSWPRNQKAKRLGRIVAEILQTGFEAYGKSLMIHGAGLSDKEATEVIQGCLDAMRENKEHTYYQKYLSYKTGMTKLLTE